MKNKSNVKFKTIMREAFEDAGVLTGSSAGIIHRKILWNVKRDHSRRIINPDYVRPKRTVKNKQLNREQMYDFSRR